jgi:hypothetical protein
MWWGFLSETAGEPGSLRWRRKCEGSAITSAGHHGLTRYRVSQSGADPLQQLAFGLAGIIIAFIVIGLYFGGVRF